MTTNRILVAAAGLALAIAACSGESSGGVDAGERSSSATPGPGAPELPCDPAGGITLAPPDQGIYTGVYAQGVDIAAHPNPPDVHRTNLSTYAELAGKPPASGVVLDIWFDGEIKFPAGQVRTVWERGAVPRLALWPMSAWDYAGAPDPIFSMQAVIDGEFDEQLTDYAAGAKASGLPLMAGFGGEVNGGWPWSGDHNGGGTTAKYGDDEWPDGPERYRDAYRHVVDLFRAAGANNVTWVFHIGLPFPGDPEWNANRWYYPGDEYIDWIATSLYGAYPGLPMTFPVTETMDTLYAEMAALSDTKPLAIVEMGTTEHADLDKAQWIRDGFDGLRSGRWPRLVLVTWWHEYSEAEDGSDASTAIDSSPEALAAYQEAVADPVFVDTPQFACP